MTETKANILIVDDEPIKRSVLEDELSAAGYSVVTAGSPLEAESVLEKTFFNVILTDLRMPGEDGLTFLRGLKRKNPAQAVIVMTAYATVETAVEAMKLGAFDYIQKPFSAAEFILKLDRLLKYEQLENENEALRSQLTKPRIESQIIGQSESMLEVLGRIHAVAGLDTTILIEGESGTGKELVARTIHETSHRAAGPFVAVACAALPRALIETELFGHEKGAFTGAAKRRIGRFEIAHRGTLFLDDVDDIPLEIQVKLVRILQERSFERVGGEQSIQVNVRVVAATKKPLAALVAAGKFREDLYYRLNVVPLNIPPLRERLEDIPILVEYFLAKLAIKANREKLSISPSAIAKLQSYYWPGNVRELEHTLERMVALTQGNILEEVHLPEQHTTSDSGSFVSLALRGAEQVEMALILNEVEKKLINWALAKAKGNLAKAAETLGIPRSTLQYKVTKQVSPDQQNIPSSSPDYEI